MNQHQRLMTISGKLLPRIPDEFYRPYEDMIKGLTSQQHAILIDLGRTFPQHPYFTRTLGPGQLGLFNLLKAYSLLDSEVGYCQGLSFVAGILLLHVDEETAYQLLKHLMYIAGVRRQFRRDLDGLQVSSLSAAGLYRSLQYRKFIYHSHVSVSIAMYLYWKRAVQVQRFACPCVIVVAQNVNGSSYHRERDQSLCESRVSILNQGLKLLTRVPQMDTLSQYLFAG